MSSCRDYNVRKYHTIGMRPVDATCNCRKFLEHGIQSDIAIKIASPAKFQSWQFGMREPVQDDFWEELHANWTTNVFTVVNKVQHTNPVIYLLENYRGLFVLWARVIALLIQMCISEKVLRRKEDKVYVKWLEFAQFMDTKTMSFDWWKFWFMYFSTYKKYINV